MPPAEQVAHLEQLADVLDRQLPGLDLQGTAIVLGEACARAAMLAALVVATCPPASTERSQLRGRCATSPGQGQSKRHPTARHSSACWHFSCCACRCAHCAGGTLGVDKLGNLCLDIRPGGGGAAVWAQLLSGVDLAFVRERRAYVQARLLIKAPTLHFSPFLSSSQWQTSVCSTFVIGVRLRVGR